MVHWDQHRNHSHAPTSEDTAHDEERNGGRSGLHGNTSKEDEDSEDDGPSPTEDIRRRGSEESPEKGTSGQDGDDEGLLG